jgi:hypothetical protein
MSPLCSFWVTLPRYQPAVRLIHSQKLAAAAPPGRPLAFMVGWNRAWAVFVSAGLSGCLFLPWISLKG